MLWRVTVNVIARELEDRLDLPPYLRRGWRCIEQVRPEALEPVCLATIERWNHLTPSRTQK